MDLQTMTYLVVGGTFALYIGIAIWARASTTGEFYVAGKGVHPVRDQEVQPPVHRWKAIFHTKQR